jgi:ATPase family associated with various cellular activities (AAA)
VNAGGLGLGRLDAALEREILRLRARYQLTLDEFRGLYVSDEQVDALLAAEGGDAGVVLPPLAPARELVGVIARFGLDGTAADVLLLALAPDIEPKYGTLVAYLNDDVRRRWPTVDLARRLFGPGVVSTLAPDGALFGPGLLVPLPVAEARVAQPLQEFAAHPVLVEHLLGRSVRPVVPTETMEAAGDAGSLAGLEEALGGGMLAILTGDSADRAASVGGLAARAGREIVRCVPASAAELRDAMLAARLADALLVVEPDALALPALVPALRVVQAPVFLLAPPGDAWRAALAGCAGLRIACAPPDRSARQMLWTEALRRAGLRAPGDAVAEVADRFRLSGRQIEAAAASLRLVRGGAVPRGACGGAGDAAVRSGAARGVAASGNAGRCGAADLIAAAREQSGADLAGLAKRVALSHAWEDLVLPLTCLQQLRRFAAAIRHRERVFAGWGVSGGPGLTALFGGGPGTGKTMSAGVLAREAGLDLWRIDLSAVVSKYIGDTEKHLDQIFDRARDGNAVLFFDEADALFGKRSEVKDAHDRYANIEVAYLLQRLEAYDGVVILATNLARNIDPAFGRRLHFVIDFPLPDAALRERLWRAALPPRAPLAADLDTAFLARQFALAGGDIRVAALDAAFAAAADNEPIDMVRLLQAVGRQLLKQGKVPQGSDLREYRALVADADARSARPLAAE